LNFCACGLNAEFEFDLILTGGDFKPITFFLAFETSSPFSSKSILIEGVNLLKTPEFLPL
jgi:hypothetical protein